MKFIKLLIIGVLCGIPGLGFSENVQELTFFTLPGCHDCEEAETQVFWSAVRTLESRGIKVQAQVINILEPQGFELAMERVRTAGVPYPGTPFVSTGKNIYAGNNLLTENLTQSPPQSGGPEPQVQSAPPGLDAGIIFLAGLVDGVNPCALTTLIFLISALSLSGKNRNLVLPVGLSFTLGVFTAYTLIGLGLTQLLTLMNHYFWLKILLEGLTLVALVLMAGLSFWDAWKAKTRQAQSMVLKLPAFFQERIHGLLRNRKTPWLAGGGAFLLGGLISLLEFVCTGQVYLPALVYITRQDLVPGLGLLLWYNFAFIAPLLAVFLLVNLGITHKRLVQWAQKHLVLTKISLGLVFLALGFILTLPWLGIL